MKVGTYLIIKETGYNVNESLDLYADNAGTEDASNRLDLIFYLMV